MKARVYLRRNLTELAGAVASGGIKLAITRERSHDILFLRTMDLSLVMFCFGILIGNCVYRSISMFIIS